MITHTEARQIVRLYAEAMINHNHPIAQQANRQINVYLDALPQPMRNAARYDFSGVVCKACDELMRETSHK